MTVESAPFFIKGEIVDSSEVVHRSRDLGVDFATPSLDLNSLVTPRTEAGPLFDVKLSEIIDFLAETGNRLAPETNPYIQACIERTASTNVLPARILENQFYQASLMLNKSHLVEVVEQNFSNPAMLDGWVSRTDSFGRNSSVRAFPPRLIHVLPGNSPVAAMQSLYSATLTKGINLFKMGSSDPFTAVAFLRTMADIDPDHPVVKSMTAVYWRGGDESVERNLYRPQYFDKIVAWGGGDAINNVIRYLGPGFQLISFDPKTSISMIGAQAFDSDAILKEVAERAASDVCTLNQQACLSSRFIFIEGEIGQVDDFCDRLIERMGVERDSASAEAPALDRSRLEEIETLVLLDDDYRVWGLEDNKGIVIRSESPVDFHPTNKTVNVVRVNSLDEAVRYVNVATQTIGIYPFQRAVELRDRLASCGAQRVVRLGEVTGMSAGSPHDATYPLHRMVHWVVNEDGGVGD